MLGRISPKLVLALLLFVTGAVVVARALNRPGVERALDGEAFDPPGLLALKEIRFDARFTESAKERVFENIAARIVESAGDDEKLAPVLDRAARERLATAFTAQLDVSIFGSCEAWLGATTAAGATPRHTYFGRIGDAVTPERFCELWRLAQSRIVGAPVASEQAFVRPCMLNGRQVEWKPPPQIVPTRFVRDYDRDIPDSLVVECIVPVSIRLGDRTQADWIVQLSIQFGWDESTRDWMPLDLVLYSNLSRSGTFIVPPL